MNFLGHAACQEQILDEWHGGLMRTHPFPLFVFVMFPWWCIYVMNESVVQKFRKDDDDNKLDSYPPIVQSMNALFSAPRCKFLVDLMHSIALAGLYSAVVLAPAEPIISGSEIMLALWMSSVLMERLHIMYHVGNPCPCHILFI